MKFLLHSNDASYNAVKKTWMYSLSQRLRSPSQMVLENVSFIVSTMTNYPSVVYMRSDSLSRHIRNKHCVQVKDEERADQQVDVLCVLTETHTLGRYRQRNRVRYRLNPHTWLRQIDIYFTDGAGTKLSGVYTPAQVSGTSDADIEALFDSSEITFLVDCADANSVLEQGTNTNAEVGDYVGHLYSKHPSDVTKLDFVPNQNNAIVYKEMNTNLKSISGSPSVSWEAWGSRIVQTIQMLRY